MTGRVHDDRVRRQHRLDVVEQEESLFAVRDLARGGRAQDAERGSDLRHQRRDTRVARRTLGPNERGVRCLRSNAPNRDSRDYQLVSGPQRRRERRRFELTERSLGLVQVTDQ